MVAVKSNSIKHILREGQPSFGTWLSLGDLFASRVLARLGFDWLTLDLEHWPIDWSQAAMSLVQLQTLAEYRLLAYRKAATTTLNVCLTPVRGVS